MTDRTVPIQPDPDTEAACREVGREERSWLGRIVERFADHCRARSLYVLHYCTGCGAIELPPSITARFDLERLGVQPMATPRQADILLITGYLSVKTLKRVLLTYEQMPAPKYVVGFGSCTINGGMYWHSYATIKQLDNYLPVDLYLAGCMPRPEAIQQMFLELIRRIDAGEARAWEDYYRRYDAYLGAQQALFGPQWQGPTDVVGDARAYGLLGPETLGAHTARQERSAFYHRELGVAGAGETGEEGP